LRKHWPNLRLSAVQNTSEGFFHDLLENRIDCAFPALEPKGIDLTSHKLCTLEIGLVLPPDHRLADQSEIRFDRLKNERWILPPREANPVLYDELISCCHKASFTPNVIAEMTQRPRVVSQVACGIGIATLVQLSGSSLRTQPYCVGSFAFLGLRPQIYFADDFMLGLA
jgi:DNA-binding transcriptional LysR family regulator